MAEDKKTRVSKITKSITRTFNTAKYESLVINVGYEEVVEWTEGNMPERQDKSEKITKVLLDDFDKTATKVFKHLGLTENNVNSSEKKTISAKSQGLDLDGDKLGE
jgi:hypothetical protein